MKVICIILALIATVYSQKCADGNIYQPVPGTSFFWELSQTISTATITSNPTYQVYDFDLFFITHDMVNLIHSLNKTLICYIDTAYEPYRNDSKRFTSAVKGKEMDGWPGQHWVDIRSDIVKQIMFDRLQMAVALGCDAIEWDDVDAYSNDNGFHLGFNDQLNFNLYLANITHQAGLSVGLKNDLDQIDTLVDYFDWALNEQCNQFQECDTMKPFVAQNKAVFGAEYKGDASEICPNMNSIGFSFIRTDIDLDGTITPCCQYLSPPCPTKSFNCVAAPTSYPVYPSDSSAYSLSLSLSLFLFALAAMVL